MANSYTEKLKKRIIGAGDPNWDDEGHANEYINEVALAALMSTNRIEVGGAVTDAGGLLVGVSAVSGRVAGDHFSLPADTLSLSAALPGEEQSNWIYIDDTPQLQVSNVPPTGDYLPLALVDTDNAGVLLDGSSNPRIADLRAFAQPVEGIVENDCINGTFDAWQRGTLQIDTSFANGYGSDDRFFNTSDGSSSVHEQGVFDIGQEDVPGGPEFFSKTTVTSVAGGSNYAYKEYRMPLLSKYSGNTMCIDFFGMADADKSIAIEVRQVFGTGGSATILIGAQTVLLTTIWDNKLVFFQMPSIAGKTIGDNSKVSIIFWFDAGSNYVDRTNGLGQQSGVFSLAEINIYPSDKKLPMRRPNKWKTLWDCLLFYETSGFAHGANRLSFRGDVTNGYQYDANIQFLRKKIRTPSVSITDVSRSGLDDWDLTITNIGIQKSLLASSTLAARYYIADWAANSEI